MKEIILPSGVKAVIRDGKGRDLLNAQRIASTPEEIVYALIAELTEIEGKKIVFEDLLDMPLQDVMTIMMEVTGNFTLSLPNKLSNSQESQVGGLAKSKK